VSVFGLTFPNPLGVAAGFDRSGTLVDALAAAGFGFVEVGTVTPDSEPGRCRGAAAVAERLSAARRGAIVGINVGSLRPGLGDPVRLDCVAVMRTLREQADYFVANLSSPLRRRDTDPARLDGFLGRLARERDAVGVPLLVKAVDEGDGVPAAVQAAKRLGLDGVVLVTASTRRVAELADLLAPMPLISVGGIADAEGARARLRAGAALVQAYTGFVRGGVRFPRRLVEGLP
jgi:dihydroorotate dehydrogenase